MKKFRLKEFLKECAIAFMPIVFIFIMSVVVSLVVTVTTNIFGIWVVWAILIVACLLIVISEIVSNKDKFLH